MLMMDTEYNIYGTPSLNPMMPQEYQRLVHLDLKGAPPKLDYLLKILPLFKEWGATGLLVEYEDTFPYSGKLEILRREQEAYSLGDILSLQQVAKGLGLQYIPLVQTFGHLEFVLKNDQFHHLREDPQDVRSVCPSHPDSIKLIQSMIDQVMTHHPDIKHFHIGADEVWMKERCQKCHHRIQESYKGDPVRLYLSHMGAVLAYLAEKYPTVRPIMWDDMLRVASYDVINDSKLGDSVDIMVWNYLDRAPSFHMSMPEKVWQLYGKLFKNLWVASAFKGAFGPTLFLTPELEHIRNQELWVNCLRTAVPKCLSFKGIAFTGWQRYTHQTVLCELLPVGLPSLAFCLQTFIQGRFSEEIHQMMSQRLGFVDLLSLKLCTGMPLSEIPVDAPKATYPGSDMYTCARQLATLQSCREGQQHIRLTNQSAFLYEQEACGPLTEKDSPPPILSGHMKTQVVSLLGKLTGLKSTAEKALSDIYHPPTVTEWLNLCLMPLIKHFEGKLETSKALNA